MKFEDYKIEVVKFGKEIGWDFVFKENEVLEIELLAPTVNNLNPLIKWFSHDYIQQNEDWTSELNWLKKKIIRF